MSRARFAIGVVCVLAAAALLILKVPRTIGNLDSSVRGNAYITDPIGRSLTEGDMLGISRDLQLQAIAKIPRGSAYAVLLPSDQQLASSGYGIEPVTYETLAPWLNYLLLPSRQVSPKDARYVICWGCDTTPWDHRTTWLFDNDQGVAIGRVRGR
jgi:hypothetical protein